MTAAQTQTRPRSETRLLVASHAQGRLSLRHLRFEELPSVLRPGDVLVVNDAATLPASFAGRHRASGAPLELRLSRLRSPDGEPRLWSALLFGEGDWRTPTERRAPPPQVGVGDRIDLNHGLSATVTRGPGTDGGTDGYAEVRFEGRSEDLWSLLYRAGRPIQYSHLAEELSLWDVQTPFAGPPVSLEPPSAALPLSWELVFALERAGVRVVALTHAAGISSTGRAELDRALPGPERYWIPETTAAAVNQALREGHRVIALGTTVTRALESAADAEGRVRGGSRETTLVMTPEYERRVVGGIISGFHENGASHLRLLGGFLPPGLLETAYREAENRGYLSHEFGDSCLLT